MNYFDCPAKCPIVFQVPESMDDPFSLKSEFIAAAEALPAEYQAYLSPPGAEYFSIPSPNPAVGPIEIRCTNYEIIVSIGNHTRVVFEAAGPAVNFLWDVISDEIVFQITPRGATQYAAAELSGAVGVDENYHVWSGLFLENR
jgi:hypothetical protein